ncbi:MAG: AAA family ATPase [Hydrogenophilales bacterium]|nr:AAA family ATPase [Hydrogenophilales bacterium]
MSELDAWLQANDRYLADALSELRQRLERLAGQGAEPAAPERVLPVPEAPAVAPGLPPKQRSLLERLFSAQPKPVEASSTLSAGAEVKADPAATTVVVAEPSPEAMPEAGASEPTSALLLLAQRLGLTEFERNTLLLCAAMEFDTRIAVLCARAQGDAARPYPTFALALALFDNPAWDILSPERPLRYWRLVEINQPGAQPLVTSAVKADERIVNYLKGLNYLDDRLAPLTMPVGRPVDPLPPSQMRALETVVNHVEKVARAGSLPVFQLVGSDSASKLAIAGDIAARLGLTLYRLPADAVPAQAGDHETLVRLWQRESALMPIALYIDASELERAASPQASAIQRLVGRGMGLVFLDTREPWPEPGRESIVLDVAKPSPEEQRVLWEQALGGGHEGIVTRLAAQFSFNTAAIRSVAGSALAMAGNGGGQLDDTLWTECLRQARPALDQLAQVLEPKAGWDDLELPLPEKRLLRQIADQVASRMAVYDDWGFRERMNRGLGISVLFAGESGTGKTMAAEVIAKELGLLIYRIDLSAVVSKYIGETEKNLRKLFDAAEDSGAILFFDEADALFGKRSEVKDSHDRYANIEINYLLQRMESYRGLAILATNMKGALDNAFVRRLRFVVNFPFPGPTERVAIWQHVFPQKTPIGDLDLQRLARLNITGGSISNIALNAAFLAAQSGSRVTMPLVLEAARNEFRKMERPINEADFRWLEAAGGKA